MELNIFKVDAFLLGNLLKMKSYTSYLSYTSKAGFYVLKPSAHARGLSSRCYAARVYRDYHFYSTKSILIVLDAIRLFL